MRKTIATLMALVVCALLLTSISPSLVSSRDSSTGDHGVNASPETSATVQINIEINNLYNYFPGGALWQVFAKDITANSYTSAVTGEDATVLNLPAIIGTNIIEISFYPPTGFNFAYPLLSYVMNVANTYSYLNVQNYIYPAKYPVSFLENGLPAGTQWGIRILNDGNDVFNEASQQNAINLWLETGTYQYQLYPVPGYVSDQAVTGTFTVVYSPEALSMLFSVHKYQISLVENGLPSGTSWQAQVNGTSKETNATYMDFSLPNGTYHAYLSPIPGFTSGMSSFNIIVNGSNVYQTITFARKLYPVTIQETGLPPGTYWSAEVNGTETSSNSSVITFMEPNGSYYYHVFPVQGYHILEAGSGNLPVNGVPVHIIMNFKQIAYRIQFNPTGLPAYLKWGISMGNVSLTAPGNGNISMMLPNGTYYLNVVKPSGYSAYVQGGLPLNVDGKSLFLAVEFIRNEYMLNITSAGLPDGSPWILTLSNGISTGITYSGQVSIMVPNGTFPYTVQSLNHDFKPSAYNGIIMVSGKNLDLYVNFTAVHYVQSFVLLSGSNAVWSISINGMTIPGKGPMIIVSLQNGTYPYTIHYGKSIFQGSLLVNGSDQLLMIGSSGVTDGSSGSYSVMAYISGAFAAIFVVGASVMFRRR